MSDKKVLTLSMTELDKKKVEVKKTSKIIIYLDKRPSKNAT